jgi:serine/threonine protein kinase/tetratricopeptide (TPR) repeat protein
MPDWLPESSREHWQRVAQLFARMQDASDPLALASSESDPRIASEALRLWQSLGRAESAGFLAQPVELIQPPAVAPDPQFAVGQTLAGRFEIVQLLGEGGMGEVYQAMDHRLHETVAVKTIRAPLASDPAIRAAFLIEVQSARRVTHPNVCRINDLFEESGLPFLSMEYLPGDRLSTWIEKKQGTRRLARALALQLAEGLASAHRAGILHCDFKPSNVILTGPPDSPRAVTTDFGLARAMRGPDVPASLATHSLRAGTFEYMAPELLAGSPPTVQTDIYAFGRVLGQLLPNHRMVSRCQVRRPEDRPASLEPVIRSLRGDLPRRLFFATGIAAAAAATTYELAPRPRLPLAARTRIAINGLRGVEPRLASVFRELLITALRQSTLLTVVADDQLRRQLKARGNPGTLPADRAALASATGPGMEIALVIEGVLASATRGLRVSLDVFAPTAVKPSLSVNEQVQDPKNLVGLADLAALQLRREFGESRAALQAGAGYTPLAQVTSASPEAVDCYFRGMEEHNRASADSAITWFDQAVRLDPNFALAWLQRGVSLMSYRLPDSFDSFQRAFALRYRVTDRERLWIETRYLNIIGDWDSALTSCLKLVVLFPEDPDFQREAAFQLTRLGHPREALLYNQRSVELDSSNVNNLSEWIVNNTTAGLNDDALALYERFRYQGETNMILNWGGGLAYMGKGDFDGASRMFEQMAVRPDLDHWAQRLQCGPLIRSGRFSEARSILSADVAWDLTNGEQNELDHRRLWLGALEWIMGAPAHSREHAEAIAALDALPSSLDYLREAGLLSVFLKDGDLGQRILNRLRVIEQRWPSSHTRGACCALEGALVAPGDFDLATPLFDTARGLRPDPLTLFPIALWHMESNSFEAATAALAEIENQGGRIHRMYFPGLLDLARIQRARCLVQMSHFSEALRLYERITANWRAAANYGMISEVRQEFQKLTQNLRREKND